MRSSLFVPLCLTLAALVCSCNSGENESQAVALITKDKILHDVEVLSADDMEGRAPGTPGGEKAADYIAQRFQENGLAPVNGSYFQPVKLVGSKKVAEKSSLAVRGKNGELQYISDSTLTYWSTSQKETVDVQEASLLFAGYGVEAPEYGWDDFKGAELQGKVLLFLNNDPPVTENGVALFKGEARTYYGRWTYKFEQAMRHGAAGAFMIHTVPSASYPFSVVGHEGEKEQFDLDLPGSGYQVDLLGWLDEALSNQIANAMGTDLEGLFAMAASRDFKPRDTGFKVNAHLETAIRRIATKNVFGMLEGSAPELKQQVVVFSAHYDHLGKNENLAGPDKIYNGAWDNALGTSCVINLAKAFADLKDRPKRSILFLACAAEESGSWGSKWFADNPPFQRNRLVADFNIDMPQIFGVSAEVAAIGVDMSTLGDALMSVAKQYTVTREGKTVPVEVTGDPNPNAGSFYRSDQVNFAKVGVPALYINPGKQFVNPPRVDTEAYHETHYHQVIDVVDEAWDLSGCERDMRILFQTVLRVANAADMPRWVPGSEFEEAWKKLHEKSN